MAESDTKRCEEIRNIHSNQEENEGFVILKGFNSFVDDMAGSMASSRSSIPEKQSCESQEKKSDDNSSKLSFTEQLAQQQEKALEEFGCSGKEENAKEIDKRTFSEKSSEPFSEKIHVEDLVMSLKEAPNDEHIGEEGKKETTIKEVSEKAAASKIEDGNDGGDEVSHDVRGNHGDILGDDRKILENNNLSSNKSEEKEVSKDIPVNKTCVDLATTGTNKESQNGDTSSDKNGENIDSMEASETPGRSAQSERVMDVSVRHRRPPAQPRELPRNQPAADEGNVAYSEYERRWPCCKCIMFSVCIALVVSFIVFIPPPKPVTPGPIIQITSRKHVAPSSESWQLNGSCHGYNETFIIIKCSWTQIHPKPTNPHNSVFKNGVHDCLHGNRAHVIDANVSNLQVPKDLGNYVFELQCTDSVGNTNDERVDIWIKELIPPIITVAKENIVMCVAVGSTQLNASCQAVQGKVAQEKWKYVSGRKRILPERDGIVKIDEVGEYEFKFRCEDSYGGVSSKVVNVMAKPSYVLGIDLGTSTTCLTYINEAGISQDINIYYDDSDTDPCMPSVVAFGKDGRLLIGEEALRQAVKNPSSTIYEVKRLMGRSYYDDPTQKFLYKVRPTLKSYSPKGTRAAIEIPCGNEKKLLQPELVSALILRRVADVAERYLKFPAKDAVISVPAQFDDAQRKATMDAAYISGLRPIKIVNEPTVAAFAARNATEEWQNRANAEDPGGKKNQDVVWVVVADIGGGTTDYALMQIDSRNFYKVRTTDGNKSLGGRDIDITLAKKLTEIIGSKEKELDVQQDEFQQELRLECEKAKVALSKNKDYLMTIPYGDKRLHHLLTREAFENYISEILRGMISPLDSLLAKGNVRRDSIDELYLVGGTSNIPKLKETLVKYFDNVNLRVLHKDPIQLVSRGTAAFGAVLTKIINLTEIPEIDVTPLPIKIAVDMDEMHEIFPRNYLYPCLKSQEVTTFANEQTSIVVKVYEGEGSRASEMHFLGELELSGIPPKPKEVPQINTRYTIDSNGILSVTATYGKLIKTKNLDVYTKSGSMLEKTKENLRSLLAKLMSHDLSQEPVCSFLEAATEMKENPRKPEKRHVLQLFVDSKYENVLTQGKQAPTTVAMVSVTGLADTSEVSTKGADMDIVLVIDKSGSMQGDPIETVKGVILNFVDVLKDNHRIGIVTYDNNVHSNLQLTYCTDTNKKLAKNIVNGVVAAGGTNLYGGLRTGLQMAYNGGRRARVLLFTDGYANIGFQSKDDIIREISKEVGQWKMQSDLEVKLFTFGYRNQHDEDLLSKLAANTAGSGGTYNYLDENTELTKAFAKFLDDAIHSVAEDIQLKVTPLNGVYITKITSEFCKKHHDNVECAVPSMADQHSLHILMDLTLSPCNKEKVHDIVFHVDLTYKNTITNRVEGNEESLYVGRSKRLDMETRSREVDAQLNRVFVVDKITVALRHLNEGDQKTAAQELQEAEKSIRESLSKDSTLSLCLLRDLHDLIYSVEHGDEKEATKKLRDSLMSHVQEKGGRSSCYTTRKEDKLIKILNIKTSS